MIATGLARQAPIGIRFKDLFVEEGCGFVPFTSIQSIGIGHNWKKDPRYFVYIEWGWGERRYAEIFRADDLSSVEDAFGSIMQQIADGAAIIEVP